MKLQSIALGLALAMAGTAFAATTRDVTVTRSDGTVVHKHVVRTSEHHMYRGPQHYKKVVVVHPTHHFNRRVTVIHPAEHGRHLVNRTVVIHRDRPDYAVNRTVVVHRRG